MPQTTSDTITAAHKAFRFLRIHPACAGRSSLAASHADPGSPTPTILPALHAVAAETETEAEFTTQSLPRPCAHRAPKPRKRPAVKPVTHDPPSELTLRAIHIARHFRPRSARTISPTAPSFRTSS